MVKQISMTLDSKDIAEAVRLWMMQYAAWAPEGTLDVRAEVEELRDCRDVPTGRTVSLQVTITPKG